MKKSIKRIVLVGLISVGVVGLIWAYNSGLIPKFGASCCAVPQ